MLLKAIEKVRYFFGVLFVFIGGTIIYLGVFIGGKEVAQKLMTSVLDGYKEWNRGV